MGKDGGVRSMPAGARQYKQMTALRELQPGAENIGENELTRRLRL
jgi:hypothetical protein